jgi:hypothetical protein
MRYRFIYKFFSYFEEYLYGSVTIIAIWLIIFFCVLLIGKLDKIKDHLITALSKISSLNQNFSPIKCDPEIKANLATRRLILGELVGSGNISPFVIRFVKVSGSKGHMY